MQSAYLAKIPYINGQEMNQTPVDKKDTYNFLDGLEQRYDMNALDSVEKRIFNKT